MIFLHVEPKMSLVSLIICPFQSLSPLPALNLFSNFSKYGLTSFTVSFDNPRLLVVDSQFKTVDCYTADAPTA